MIITNIYATPGMTKRDIFAFRQNIGVAPNLEAIDLNKTYTLIHMASFDCDPEKNNKEKYICHVIRMMDEEGEGITMCTSSETFSEEIKEIIAEFGNDEEKIVFKIYAAPSKNYKDRMFYKPLLV